MAISKKLPANFTIFYFLSIGVLFFLIYTARIALAGRFLTLILALHLLYSVFSNIHPLRFTMVILIYAPFLAYLRQYVISYNGILLILFAALALWALQDQKVFLRTIAYKPALQISLFLILFVLYGILVGNSLLRFLKFIETIMALMTFSMALYYLEIAKKYLIFFVFSSIALMTALLPFQGTRFIIESEGQIYGADPSTFSIALVLSVILIWTDKGIWTPLFGKIHTSKIRNVILFVLLALIILSTSRGGFFTVLGVISIYLIILRLPPKKVFTLAIAFFVVLTFVMNSKYSETMNFWINKTFFNVRGVDAATSGRTYQWSMAGQYLLSDDPFTILIGYGPGNGPEFNRKYSYLVPVIGSWRGTYYVLHSLYLNIFVEFGFLAFIAFGLFAIKFIKRNYRIFKRSNNAVPFLCLAGYMIYISSVSGMGLVAGFLFSIATININYLIPNKS